MLLNKSKDNKLWRMTAVRLSFLFTFSFLTILCFAGFIANYLIWQEIEKQMQTSLLRLFQENEKALKSIFKTASFLKIEHDYMVALAPLKTVPTKNHLDRNDLFDKNGFFILDGDKIDSIFTQLEQKLIDNEGWYFYAQKVNERTLVVGQDLNIFYEIIEEGRQALAMAAIFAIIVTVVIGIWVGLHVNARIKKITNVLNNVSEGDLTSRIGNKKQSSDIDLLMLKIDKTLNRFEILFNQTQLLSSNIAHELKTPLARLQIQISQAQIENKTTALYGYFEKSQTEITRMLQIFDSIIRISNLEINKTRSSFKQLIITDLLSEIVDTYEPILEDENKTIILKITNELVIEADSTLLFQLFSNIIENAVHHTPQNTTLTIEVIGKKIIIVDNGGGVENTLIPKLTNPLFQISEARETGRSGLGLALVKAIAEHHNATLKFENSNLAQNGLKISLQF